MDLDDPAQLRHELSRLYRALEESESKTKQIQKTNEKLKTDLERTLHALFFLTCNPQLFLFFWGLLDV